jgi:hypothetical protein
MAEGDKVQREPTQLDLLARQLLALRAIALGTVEQVDAALMVIRTLQGSPERKQTGAKEPPKTFGKGAHHASQQEEGGDCSATG